LSWRGSVSPTLKTRLTRPSAQRKSQQKALPNLGFRFLRSDPYAPSAPGQPFRPLPANRKSESARNLLNDARDPRSPHDSRFLLPLRKPVRFFEVDGERFLAGWRRRVLPWRSRKAAVSVFQICGIIGPSFLCYVVTLPRQKRLPVRRNISPKGF
jgi:hypothetical protein